MKRGKPRREFFACPNCGADVPIGRRACPECGSDDTTGWQSSEEIDYQSLDLPTGYAEDDAHPGGSVPTPSRSPLRLLWILLVIAAFAVWAILAAR